MTQWRKGSAGAADQKESIRVSIFFGLITVGVLLVQWVIPSQYRDEVKDASTAWNVVGFILTILSLASIVVGSFWNEETKGFKWAWIIFLVLGFFCAAGWFDNSHSYLNNY